MSKVKFNVACVAVYESSLNLPDDIDTSDKDAVLEFILDNLSNAQIESKLEYVNDLTDEPVTYGDIKEII